MKYLVLNKESDYRRGRWQNLCFEDGELRLADCSAKKPGRFFSRTLDSGEKETIWHRMVMEASIGENMAVYVCLYATDSNLRVKQIEEAWNREEDFLSQAESSLSEICMLKLRNPEDILRHQVQGRYLWLGMTLWGSQTGSPGVSMIQIYFPKEVWNRYLPEIYQDRNQEFLERFLAVFQSLYEDMDRRIRKDTSWLDLQAVDDEKLVWLASWLHVENSHLWKPEQLRQYLSEGSELFERRGTPGGLIRMVELFTGEKPWLAEAEGTEDPHCFTLYLREQVVASSRDYRAVERIVREGKPAGMEVCLVILRPYFFLDQNTYLGINSWMNDYGPAVLESGSAFDFVVLKGDAQNEEPDLFSV